MKIHIEADEKNFKISIPRWLYMNKLGISLLALRKDVPFTPKQGRKALKAIKKTMKEYDLSAIATVEIDEKDSKINIMV